MAFWYRKHLIEFHADQAFGPTMKCCITIIIIIHLMKPYIKLKILYSLFATKSYLHHYYYECTVHTYFIHDKFHETETQYWTMNHWTKSSQLSVFMHKMFTLHSALTSHINKVFNVGIMMIDSLYCMMHESCLKKSDLKPFNVMVNTKKNGPLCYSPRAC